MADWREDLLTAILDCGYGDLYLLKDCQYDIGEIVEECEETFGGFNINNLVRIMFDCGLRDIETARDDRIRELEAIPNERNLDEDEATELEVLSRWSRSRIYSRSTTSWTRTSGSTLTRRKRLT